VVVVVGGSVVVVDDEEVATGSLVGVVDADGSERLHPAATTKARTSATISPTDRRPPAMDG
jgi:hypothetical protein